MSRRQKDPLRPLSEAERTSLSRLSRSQSAPAAQVARARALLAVAMGQSYTASAQLVGRDVGDTEGSLRRQRKSDPAWSLNSAARPARASLNRRGRP